MVDVKDATARAIQFAQDVLNTQAGELLLEEIYSDQKDSEKVWMITLSMPKPRINPVLSYSGFLPRVYKTFAVSQATGDVLSMKIRELANAE